MGESAGLGLWSDLGFGLAKAFAFGFERDFGLGFGCCHCHLAGSLYLKRRNWVTVAARKGYYVSGGLKCKFYVVV